MNIKKIIFIAHDPGGYDVIYPLVQQAEKRNINFDFFCIGPAAKLNSKFKISEKELIEKININCIKKEIGILVTGTSWGNDTELTAIQICNEANIPTMSILDYWAHYKLRFINQQNEYIYPDYYIIMDNLAKQEALQEGVPSDILYVLGHPGLDYYINNEIKKEKIKDTKKKILFLSQPLSQLYGESLGYTEMQVVEDCIKLVERNQEFSLKIKFHPKDSSLFQKKYSYLAVESNIIEILQQYDYIIGMNTMALLHAVLMGSLAVNYQPDLCKEDQCITNKLGFTQLITSFNDLEAYFENISFKTYDTSLNKNSLIQNYIWLDGKSTERVSNFILEVLKNEN